MSEDDNSHVDGTQDGQLMRFLEQTAFTLEEGTIKHVRLRQWSI